MLSPRHEHCLYAGRSACSGSLRSVELRGDEDVSAVLVCRAHYGRLRRLDPSEADKLERFLVDAFGGRRSAA